MHTVEVLYSSSPRIPVDIGGRSVVIPSVIEDDDGQRLLLTATFEHVPVIEGIRAAELGAQAIFAWDGQRWSGLTMEAFADGRQDMNLAQAWRYPYDGLAVAGPSYRELIDGLAPLRRTAFVHLHAHSEFSPLDGLTTIPEMVREVTRDNQEALAVTDHGVCAGHLPLQRECARAGIKPIFGIEANFVDDRLTRPNEILVERDGQMVPMKSAKEVMGDYRHLVLWAQNNRGLQNIWSASTEANTGNAFYGRPRMDWSTLERHSEGVMASTACLRGPLSRWVMADDEQAARATLARLLAIYGDRLYIELHTNSLPEQRKVNETLVVLAKEHGVPLIASVDSHYPCHEHSHAHRVWLAAQTKKELADDTGLFEGDGGDYYLMSEAEVRASLAYLGESVVDEAVASTKAVADRCDAKIEGNTFTPTYSRMPTREASVEEDKRRLLDICLNSWSKTERTDIPQDVYFARLENEMMLLIEKEFCFTAGTMVTMADGAIVPIEKIAVGDSVVTKTGLGTVAKVQSKLPDRLLSVRVAGGAWPLNTTPDHPVWVRSRGWVRADALVVGDYMALREPPVHSCSRFDVAALARDNGWDIQVDDHMFRRVGAGRWGVPRAKSGWMPSSLTLDEDWGFLIGLWIAEGHREVGSNEGQVAWTLRAGEPAVDRLCAAIEALGLGSPRVYGKRSKADPDHQGVTVKITNHPLWLLLGHLVGDGTRGKELAPWLVQHPHADRLVSGWFAGDGTVGRNGRHVVDTVNPVLARQLRRILLRSGEWATTTRLIRSDGVESYRTNWSPNRVKRPYGALRDEDGQWWVRVSSIATVPPQEVYSLTVAGDPSYVAEDLLVHNCGYFLIVWDYVKWAKDQGYLVGPGRGSGAGSLVAYLAGITGIDPVEADLLFERFLTPGRTSPPDFDIDFPSSSRHAIQNYVVQRWGAENVMRVGTHLRLKNKGVIKSLARVYRATMDIHWPDIEEVSHIITAAEAGTAGLGLKWEDLWAQYGDLLEPYRVKYPELFAMAEIMVGRLQSYGRHAAGLVISTDGTPLTDRYPMRASDDGTSMISEFDMNDLEFIGLLKFDFLTLRTLDTCQEAVDLIREMMGHEINFDEWSEELRDPQVWGELADGHTMGVFQIETSAGTSLTKRFQPDSMAGLSDVITLVRPGPMNSGLTDIYLRRRAGQEAVSFPHPAMERVLAPTQGCIIYQEQVMAACALLAGYDMAEADNVRRILGKKKVEAAKVEGSKFIARAVECGVPEQVVVPLWAAMEEFSRYSFNKAHAWSYATLGYWTAWLKVHYPREYLCAVLSTVDKERIPEFIHEARTLGYKVLPPDINASKRGFRPDGIALRYGLDSIAGLGEAVLEAVLPHQPYVSFEDFLERRGPKCNAGHIRLLARVGAFDSLVPNRRALETELAWNESPDSGRCRYWDGAVEGLPCRFGWSSEPLELGKSGRPKARKPPPKKCTKACRQYDRVPDRDFSTVEPYTAADIRDIEYEIFGLWLSSSPFDRIPAEHLEVLATASDVKDGPVGEYTVVGVIEGIRPRTDSAGRKMAFVTLNARTGPLDVAVFASNYDKFAPELKERAMVYAIVNKNSRGVSLTALAPC